MTTDAARKAVFNNSELLENIISFLPPRDILTTVQRLSRQWKTAVETSPIVRNKLLMTSCKAPAIQSIGFADEHIPRNPMWGQGARPMYSCALALNTALFDKTFHGKGLHTLGVVSKLPSHCLRKFDNNGAIWTFTTITIDCHFNGSYQDAGSALSPAWRTMYLTDPPITTGMLELHPGPSAFYGPDDFYLHLTACTGITLGLLYDTIFATFGAQCGATMDVSDIKHFFASLYLASASASLGTSILVGA